MLYFTSPASGKRIMFSLGRWPAVSLTEARKPARAARELLDVGQCPRAFEQTQEAAQEIEAQIGTVDSLFTEYIASLRRDNKRSADYVEKLRTRTVSPAIGSLRACAVRREDVVRMLRPTAPTPAYHNRVLAFTRAAWNFGLSLEADTRHRGGTFALTTNPTLGIAHRSGI